MRKGKTKVNVSGMEKRSSVLKRWLLCGSACLTAPRSIGAGCRGSQHTLSSVKIRAGSKTLCRGFRFHLFLKFPNYICFQDPDSWHIEFVFVAESIVIILKLFLILQSNFELYVWQCISYHFSEKKKY